MFLHYMKSVSLLIRILERALGDNILVCASMCILTYVCIYVCVGV
jgi:hypothetical protein